MIIVEIFTFCVMTAAVFSYYMQPVHIIYLLWKQDNSMCYDIKLKVCSYQFYKKDM